MKYLKLLLIWLCLAFCTPVLCLAEWNQEFFDYTVKKGVGMTINAGQTGTTGSVVFGSVYSINHLAVVDSKLVKTKIIEVGTVDIGLGAGETTGGRPAIHGGVGACLYSVLCISEVYAMKPQLVDEPSNPFRTNIFVDIVNLGRLVSLDSVPGIGSVFK